MNQYTQFLTEYSHILAAFSWRQYQRHGKGFISIQNIDGTVRISWHKPAPNTRVAEVVENCDFNKSVVVKFPDGTVMRFIPTFPPATSYSLVTPQLTDFISSMSPNSEWVTSNTSILD